MLAILKSCKFYSLCKAKSRYKYSVLLIKHKHQTKDTMQDKKEKEKKGKKTKKEIKTHDLTPNKDAKGGGGGHNTFFGPPPT